MKIVNDANTTIIGSNTTVVVPDSDSICAYVAIICNSGKTYKIEKECYNALKSCSMKRMVILIVINLLLKSNDILDIVIGCSGYDYCNLSIYC